MGARDLIAWVCYTPRRLFLVSMLLLTMVIGVGTLVRMSSQVAASTAGAAASRSDPPAGAGGDSSDSAGTPPSETSDDGTPPATTDPAIPDVRPFVAAAVTFVDAWGRLRPGESAAQWVRRLDPLITAELASALRLTDPGDLPDARPTGSPQVRFLTATSSLIAVPLTNGDTVLVTVIAVGEQRRVSDVQPNVGDFGDEPAPGSTPGVSPAPPSATTSGTGSGP